MNPPTPQAVPSPWMPQFSDSNAWQSWFQQASVAASPVAGKGVADLAVTLDPVIVNQLQNDYMQQFTTLWQDLLAMKTPPVADKRFKAPAWQSNTLYAFNAAAYLLNARFLMSMADAAQAPPKVKQKIRFAVQQTIDAMSPSNFLVTNPEAQKKILETKGESLTKGLANMLADMHKGRISQTDESAFEVGRNVATTEGAVVFENELFQLIQYKPLTETVYERPMLFVPPCINKYYIMDLQPGNSLVRYTVDQGHTVFLVSWRNADQSVAQATWDDYISDGVIKAIQVVQEISKQEQINALGFCVGGTLIASALAILFARGEKPVTSLTLFTALLDLGLAASLGLWMGLSKGFDVPLPAPFHRVLFAHIHLAGGGWAGMMILAVMSRFFPQPHQRHPIRAWLRFIVFTIALIGFSAGLLIGSEWYVIFGSALAVVCLWYAADFTDTHFEIPHSSWSRAHSRNPSSLDRSGLADRSVGLPGGRLDHIQCGCSCREHRRVSFRLGNMAGRNHKIHGRAIPSGNRPAQEYPCTNGGLICPPYRQKFNRALSVKRRPSWAAEIWPKLAELISTVGLLKIGWFRTLTTSARNSRSRRSSIRTRFCRFISSWNRDGPSNLPKPNDPTSPGAALTSSSLP